MGGGGGGGGGNVWYAKIRKVIISANKSPMYETVEDLVTMVTLFRFLKGNKMLRLLEKRLRKSKRRPRKLKLRKKKTPRKRRHLKWRGRSLKLRGRSLKLRARKLSLKVMTLKLLLLMILPRKRNQKLLPLMRRALALVRLVISGAMATPTRMMHD